MKHTKKSLALLLLMSAPLFADSCSNAVAPYFSIRSQSVNQPRLMAGWVDHVHRFDMEKFYGSFAVIPGYSQSFRDESIARCLFGPALQNCGDCPQIKVSGRDVSGRGSCDILADNFGLPTDFQSTITVKPRIKTFTMDFALHVGLDEWVSGLWFRAWAPFVHTRWDLNACENVTQKGVANHASGYFTSLNNTNVGTTRANLLNSALEFLREGKVPTLTNQGSTPAITFEKLRSCKWGDCGCDGDLTKNGLADLRFGLGWNFFQDDDYHLGLGIMAAAPTGNSPDGCFLFEPMVGNGNSWEVGAMWTSHVIFWRSEDEEKHFGGYLDANITHLFKTRQKRCFDLCGKPLSRYMLAQKMTSTVSGLYGNNNGTTAGTNNPGVQPSHQFANGYAPVANLTCSDVDVSVGVQADVVAMLNYTSGGFSFDLGYNLWARSCEKIEFDCDCLPRLAKSTELWALKGDARVYGFENNSTTGVALSATQSSATIFKGTNAAFTTSPQALQNFGVDNAQFAQTELTGGSIINYNNSNSGNDAQIKTSVNPVLLTQSNINLSGARTKGLSHSVFAHFSYSWLNNEDWTPFLGIGMQAEFSNNSGSSKSSCSTDTSCGTSCSTSGCDTSSSSSNCCDDCHRCSVSQWAVFVKGGISFN